MITANVRAIPGPGQKFEPMVLERRDVGPNDVLISIAFVGICHSDIHHARSKSGTKPYPLVPGHEIAGVVAAVGSDVTRFAIGDRVGVGCYVDTCGKCDKCQAGEEQFCAAYVSTYGSRGRDGNITHGGYSDRIVVDGNYVIRIPDQLPLDRAAPLLCAGITQYSPLRHWQIGPGKRVAIVGFGGLGHVGVQLSKALGAHTTVLDLSLDKRQDGLRLGADDYRTTLEDATFEELTESFDLILSTVPANIDLDRYVRLLRVNGVLVLIGMPEKPMTVSALLLRDNRRSIAGTKLGGLAQTQEMIDFCAEHNIGAEVEVVDADRIDESYDRVIAGDVRFRFVIDASTFG